VDSEALRKAPRFLAKPLAAMRQTMKSILFIVGLVISTNLMAQSDYVILSSESATRELPKNAVISSLNETEIVKITQIIEDCVIEYNSGITKSFKERGEGKYAKMYKIKKLKNYKTQYVPYINDQGEKEVWINGFCNEFNADWKSEIVTVMDGGNCYFQIRINLEEGACYEIGTNGYA
jgi:hypothetical protein